VKNRPIGGNDRMERRGEKERRGIEERVDEERRGEELGR
jgi:hypothetical protein